MSEIIIVQATDAADNELPVASTTDPGKILNSDDYVFYENVPVFVEHQRVLKNGRALQFGKHELECVVNRSNQRITETGDFAPVVIGHTSSESGAPKPPMVGWAGPFRLGWLTPAKDKYAILCDFRIEKDKAALLKDYPRRSAEIWAEERYEDMYLDPISLLGADTPWSDMGVLYSKDGSGTEKVYYSIAPQAPGAYSGLPGPVKVASTSKKEKYAMNGNNDLSADQQSIAQTIVSAIFESPEFKFIRQQMRFGKGNAQDSGKGTTVAPTASDGALKAESIADKQQLKRDDAQADEDKKKATKYEGDEGAQQYSAPQKKTTDDEDDSPLTIKEKDNKDDLDDLDLSLTDKEQATGKRKPPRIRFSLMDDEDETCDEPNNAILKNAPGSKNLEPVNEKFKSGKLEGDLKGENKYSGDSLDEPEPGDEDDSVDIDDDETNDEGLDEDDDDLLKGEDDMSSVEQLRREVKELRSLVEDLRNGYDWAANKIVSQERYAKIADLRRQYVFDDAELREKCRYNKMKTSEFEAELKKIAATHRRVPNQIGIPFGLTQNAPANYAERPGAVQYGKECDDRLEDEVMRLSDMYASKGISKSSEELREEARKNCGNKCR